MDLTVPAGQTVAVLGPSGAGKSTMLRCLAGLEPLQSGSVGFQGELLSKAGAKPRSVGGRIGMVFQQFNLFPHLTAAQNVALAPTRARASPGGRPATRPTRCWSGSAWRSTATTTRSSCPAGSSSGWPSHGPWRCGPS
ncbi:ATP-binding cassette domain-containing protein [Streptomyces sp. M19]